jgi:hypothetical protein
MSCSFHRIPLFFSQPVFPFAIYPFRSYYKQQYSAFLKKENVMKTPSDHLFAAFLLAGCTAAFGFAGACAAQSSPPLKVLIIDGQNNHDWKSTTPVMKRILEDSGFFTVDVATSPPAGANMSGFSPDFAAYPVILMNYNGDPWPQKTRDALVKYMNNGGGLVVVHAADNSFPEWPEYNKMIGLGGWGNRDEKAGPYIRFRKEVPSWLPKIRGFEYYGPYRLSPDSSLMFLSLSSEEEQFYHPYFVIIQTEKKEAIFQGRSNNQIEDIAWSPDSNMFAVLDKSSRWSFGITGILFYVLAHPIDVGKFYLSIYDWKGNLLVRTKVASGVLVGDGRVSWQGKK